MARTPVSWKTGGCLAWTPCAAVSESAVPVLRRTRRAPDMPEPCSPVQSMLSSLSVSDSAGPVLLPRAVIARRQMLPHVPLHLAHALLGWTVSDVFPASPPAEVRSECIPQKVESLPPRIPEARLLLVQCQFQPLQHPARPFQCLCRFAAAEYHEVVRVVHDSRPKLLRPPGLTPSLQHPVHIQVREQRANDGLNAKDNFEFERVAPYRKQQEDKRG